MLRKFASALLLLLAASPFTAPFSTCDAATLLGGTAPSPQNRCHLSLTSADEQSTTLVLSNTRRTRERRKLVVCAVVAAVVQQRPAVAASAAAATPASRAALARTSATTLRI